MSSQINNFNIRVYGILVNQKNEVLLSDEYEFNQYMTKFPGGRLEYGEGPADCIKREALEELGQKIEIIDHFYTIDFFQKALFYENQQLISIYYLIDLKEDKIRFKTSEKPYDFKELKNGAQSFRWRNIKSLSEDELTFPVDKYVIKLLKKKKIH